MDEFTTDTFFKGRVKVVQGRYGYRFSIDAVLLTNHIRPKQEDRVVDLGTGCGIIPLMLAFRHPKIKVYGIEIQKELAELASQNIHLNHMEDRIKIVCEDFKVITSSMIKAPVDLIICNPPFYRVNSGRINPNRQRAVARHEIKANLTDIMGFARRMLKVAGGLMMIYPAVRITDLFYEMRAHGIEPKWIRMIHSYPGDPAKLILIRGVKGAGPEIITAPPLYIYQKNDVYTEEVEKMFEA